MYRNELDTLPQYVRLVAAALELSEPTETQRLAEASGLEHDPRGVLGALEALESQGKVHALRGKGNSYLWVAGARVGPASLSSLGRLERFERLGRLLEVLSSNPEVLRSTGELVRQLGAGKNEKWLRGALKALTAIGIVLPVRFSAQAWAWAWSEREAESND